MDAWPRTGGSGWVYRSVVVSSPLAPDVACRELAVGLAGWREIWALASSPEQMAVAGRVSARRVRLRAVSGFPDSWAPVLSGRVVPVPGGCQLVGVLGWHPLVVLFSAAWLGGWVGLSVRDMADAHGDFWSPVHLALTIGMPLLLFAMVVFGSRGAGEQLRYLESWLGNRLRNPGLAIVPGVG